MAAAAVSLTCPLRRSSRLAHAHNHTHSSPPLRQSHKLKQQQHHHRHHPRAAPDPEPDQDSSSSDPENELTPRALRALKRQRLALDVDGLPLAARVRPRKRRKENIVQTNVDDTRLSQLSIKDSVERHKRQSSPTLSPLALKRPHSADNTATGDNVSQLPCTPPISIPEPTMDSKEASLSITISSPSVDERRPLSATSNEPLLAGDFNDEPSILSPKDNDTCSPFAQVTKRPVLSIPLPPISVDCVMAPPTSLAHTPTSPETLTPLTPLTPTSESSSSLPGHDRQAVPLPSPPHDPLPPSVSLETLSTQYSPIPDTSLTRSTVGQPLPLDSTPSPSTASSALSLDPGLETLIPFDGNSPQFDPEITLQLAPSPPSQPPNPPQLQGLEQEQFPSFQQPQLYVPPHPFVRDREINIWKLACQERVDCLLRRYGIDYIKALVQSEARSLFKATRSPFASASSYADVAAVSEFNASLPTMPSPTKFRLYTPASYTYTSNTWGSGSGSGGKEFPIDEDGEAGWAMDDGEWGDGDVDMDDDDDDDYEDEDDVGEVDVEREGELTLGAVEGLRIGDAVFGASENHAKVDVRVDDGMEVDGADEQTAVRRMDGREPSVQDLSGTPPTEATLACEVLMPSRSSSPSVSHPESSPRPSTSIRNTYTPSLPLTHLQRPSLPPLSSLHVPLLSEPPRAFMGRGTPPDRRRLVEWSGFGRFGSNRPGMGPPLYLSPVPQRHINADVDVDVDVGIVTMAVDAPVHPPTPLPPHTHQGEWTSFLYAMLEGDGVGVGVSVGAASQSSEPGWYELGLGSVPETVPENNLGISLSLSHSHSPAPAAEHAVDEGSSSSTLRFALG